jgi:toxin FitB
LVLIDTNVWSELSRPRPDPRVVAWMSENLGSWILSAIVFAEMEFGIAAAADQARRRDLMAFRGDILQKINGVITPFDARAASSWGPIRARLRQEGKLIGERDMLIAAHAVSLGVPLVTRNAEEMGRTGVTIINPWEA